jgi:hypothetical protein
VTAGDSHKKGLSPFLLPVEYNERYAPKSVEYKYNEQNIKKSSGVMSSSQLEII